MLRGASGVRRSGASFGRCRHRPTALYKGGQRSDRLRDPDAVIAALGIQPGQVVADLGPGYGHFTLRLAKQVAPDGVCYAADADQETLDDLMRLATERGITIFGRS